MVCPYCGEEMDKGFLFSRGPIAFSKERETLWLIGKKVVTIGSLWKDSENVRQCVWCKNCNIFIFKYEKVKKKE